MERYIGLDAHASICTLAVVGPSGNRLGSHVVETNASALDRGALPPSAEPARVPRGGDAVGVAVGGVGAAVEELVVTGVHEIQGPRSP
jgi:hypothetical protein